MTSDGRPNVATTAGAAARARPGNARPVQKRVGELRVQRGMAGADLAALIWVNPQTLSALERGDHHPSLDLAFRIGDQFGLTVDAIFSRSALSPPSERAADDGGGTATDEPSLFDRCQHFRIRRFLRFERRRADSLRGWRTRSRRRLLVIGLAVTFVLMSTVTVLCAAGLPWAPTLWLPVCLLFLPLWMVLQIVTARRGDAPKDALDEYEVAQRNGARATGLSVTQAVMVIPILYLVLGADLTNGADPNMAHAGGLMVQTVLFIGGCLPAMIVGWNRPDPE